MFTVFWLRCQCHILFLVSCCFSFLPLLSSQTCYETHQRSGLFVEIIQSPSVDPVNHGSSLNLTCSAKLKKKYINFPYKYEQPCKIDWFFNRTQVHSCSRECLHANGVMNCTLTLGERQNQPKGIVNFACKASNGHSQCTFRRISIGIRTPEVPPVNQTAPTGSNTTGIRTPEVPPVNQTAPTGSNATGIRTPEVEPVIQTAPTGSNATFRCTTGGRPKSAITWIHNGSDSNTLNETNPRIHITTGLEKGESRLVIEGITEHDYGIYLCSTKNRFGQKVSSPAFLSYPTVARPAADFPMAPTTEIRRVFVILIACVTLAICGLLYFLLHRKSRSRAKTNETGLRRPVDTDERAPLEAAYDSQEYEDTVTFERAEGELAVDPETVISSGSLGGDLGDKSIRELHRADVPPGSPLKPGEKITVDEQVEFICMWKGSDSGFDSSESSDSLFSDRETTSKSKRTASLRGQDIEENWQIDSQKLRVFDDEVLGEGEFGIVKKGHYGGKSVAVKQLKDTADVIGNSDILSEIRILKQAGQHRNIVTFMGACINSGDTLLVTELITGKSLLSLLKSKKVEFQTHQRGQYENVHFGLNDRQLLKIALQIALGMQHLHERKVIHRDLAARNVLIDQNNVAKVGDFGMARDISVDGIYTKMSDSKVPWRWLSIESLKYQVYTAFSDVWSYGIVLWEIATYGETPYPSIRTPDQLKDFLSSGERMPRPENCCEELYELMTSSWDENPSQRTQFTHIARKLKSCLDKVYKRKYVNIKSDHCKCSEVNNVQP